MPCAPVCTNTDIVTGLWRIADELHNLSAYVWVVSGIALFLLMASVVLLYVIAAR